MAQADIYSASSKAAKEYSTHLQAGANIAGFLKVAEAMVGFDLNHAPRMAQ
jgi:glutamate dehydrogenase/leucine dehydrogenase